MKVQSGYGVPTKTVKELEEIKKHEAPQDPVQLDLSKMNLTEAEQEKESQKEPLLKEKTP